MVAEIDRYSDKYVDHPQAPDRKAKIHAIVTDPAFFPPELHGIYSVERAQRLAKAPTRQASFTDTLAKLRDLEDEDGSRADEEEVEDEVVYEEEELEDETDYNVDYFDNGEDYGDHDDGDEGPVY